ncbi:hypothetical protein J6590_072133 [Homalodisca vitripennis]|nr:hypothetical protein J6590_072133 [Homalodisca vitripennis]
MGVPPGPTPKTDFFIELQADFFEFFPNLKVHHAILITDILHLGDDSTTVLLDFFHMEHKSGDMRQSAALFLLSH